MRVFVSTVSEIKVYIYIYCISPYFCCILMLGSIKDTQWGGGGSIGTLFQ